jgi:hypothetical protein
MTTNIHFSRPLLALASALCGCGEAEQSSGNYTALAERVAVLEAQVGGGSDDEGSLGDQGAALEEALTETQASLASTQADLAAANEEIGALQADLGAVQDAVDSIDLDAVAALVSGLEGDLTTLDARVAANEASIAGLGDRGGVWYEEGSGMGTCARVDVVTDSDRPLVFIATVESSASLSNQICTYYTNSSFCSGYSSAGAGSAASVSDGDSTTVAVVAANAGGTSFDETVSRTESYSNASSISAYGGSYLAYVRMTDSSSLSWTTPVQGVLEIPSAGTYTVEIQVTSTATAGTCRLVVLQP